MTCATIGDSIAVGTGQAMGCAIHARVGATSRAIAREHVVLQFNVARDLCLISAGSNDRLDLYGHNALAVRSAELSANLAEIRGDVRCKRVVWLLPIEPRARAIVQAVAARFGDAVVAFTPGRDGVHPKSYQSIAKGIGR